MEILCDVEPEVQHKAKEYHGWNLQQDVYELHPTLGGVHNKELGDEHGTIKQDIDHAHRDREVHRGDVAKAGYRVNA